MLGIHSDGVSGQLRQGNAMTPAFKCKVESVMQGPLGFHSLTQTNLVEKIHRALLQHTRPDG